jgi:hypothetical protein
MFSEMLKNIVYIGSDMFDSLAHSFTIDLDDPKVQNQFTSDELEEIRRANQKSDPALCPAIKELLNDFNNVCACQMLLFL